MKISTKIRKRIIKSESNKDIHLTPTPSPVRRWEQSLKSAFSLMEMMIVLLIVAIIAAASAPMISKKMARNAGSSDSPWVFTGLSDNIAYNLRGGDATAIIGGATYDPNGSGVTHPRLFINAGANTGTHPAIVFGQNGKHQMTLNLGGSTVAINSGANSVPGDNSVALGTGQTINSNANVVAIGQGTTISQSGSIAIGAGANSASTAIGRNANAMNSGCIAIGSNSSAHKLYKLTVKYKKKLLAWFNTELKEVYIVADSDENAKSSAIYKAQHYIGAYKNDGFLDSDNFKDFEAKIEGDPVDVGSATAGNSDAIAIGSGACARNHAWSVALGHCPLTYGQDTVAIGNDATAGATSGIAIGDCAAVSLAKNDYAWSGVAIGTNANVRGSWGVAIGLRASATGDDSVAIGPNAKAKVKNSVALGAGAVAEKDNQITLGTKDSTVYIPGNLVVGGNVDLGTGTNSTVKMRVKSGADYVPVSGTGAGYVTIYRTYGDGEFLGGSNAQTPSDRRLKNVGDAFKGGLEELKKLDLYHFTFKNDEKKTPHVGVMAQDLQKVFPDAVTTDVYGYLRIRWDEMFYSVINAVKELDTKITALTEQVKSYFDKVDKLEAQIEAQQKTIETLEKQNADFEKRIAKLEKVRNK